jgi:hypothetical protein
MTTKNQELHSILALDLDPIKVKLMHVPSGEGWSLEKTNAVEREYRRFLMLMKLYPDEATAPLEDVDTFWHYHILDTMKYAADCEEIFGFFLHHFPYVGMRGEEDLADLERAGDRMQELYEATFGESYVAAAAALDIEAGEARTTAAFCIKDKPAAAFCIKDDSAKLSAAFCIKDVQARPAAAFCIKDVQAKPAAAFCIKDIQARPAAAFCIKDVQARPAAAFCIKDVQARPAAAFCIKDVQARPAAAFCIKDVQAKPAAAFCIKDKQMAAFCIKQGGDYSVHTRDRALAAAFCIKTGGAAPAVSEQARLTAKRPSLQMA